MSMPSFPPGGADLTREEALTMIIASIAMEELALSHILNAEGEKLQYILGTLPGRKPCAGPQEVLAVNKSVTTLLEAVTQNQMLLKNKLDRALEAYPPPPCPPPCEPDPCPPPCPPPCEPDPCPPSCPPPCEPDPCPPSCPPPCQRGVLQLAGQRTGLAWNRDCRLPWRQMVRRGDSLRWEEQSPSQIQLDPQKSYVVQYTLTVRAARSTEETGAILLRQAPCGVFTEPLPLHFTIERCANRPQTLQFAAVLHPRMGCGGEAELSLVLEAPSTLCVERAVMNIMEL